MVISIETHITCDFLGGGWGPDSIPRSGSAHDWVATRPTLAVTTKKTGPTECSFGYTSILAIIRVIYLSCFGALFVKVTLFCS